MGDSSDDPQYINLHVIAMQHLMDGLALHICHGTQTHSSRVRDVSDDRRVNQSLGHQIVELSNDLLLGWFRLGCLSLGCSIEGRE